MIDGYRYAQSILRWLLIILLALIPLHGNADSTCFGIKSNGRLENAVQLPVKGSNFSAYSSIGASIGRTYVHSKTAKIIIDAYSALEKSALGKVFIYGETGWPSGGRFRPHRTHQNGLSVDFFVPVTDKSGLSAPLPTSIADKFGYNIEFDKDGKYKDYLIDFDAISEHIYQLHVAAQANGAKIDLVIFDPPFLPKLFATKRGAFLQSNIPFMKGNAWIRHDEHYHVDFAIPCKPL